MKLTNLTHVIELASKLSMLSKALDYKKTTGLTVDFTYYPIKPELRDLIDKLICQHIGWDIEAITDEID